MSNHKTSNPKFNLTLDGQEVIYTESNTRLSKSLASWFAIKNDMDFVISAFHLLIKLDEKSSSDKSNYVFKQHEEKIDESDTYQIALYRSAIVTYAKAFVSAEGRGIHLNSNIFKEQTLEILHNELYEERKKYHAHAGISSHEKLIPIIAFTKDKTPHISTITLNLMSKKIEQLEKYIVLVKFVSKYAEKKAKECGEKLLEEIKPQLETLYEKATNEKPKA